MPVCWVAFRPAANGGAAIDGLSIAHPRLDQFSMAVLAMRRAQIIDSVVDQVVIQLVFLPFSVPVHVC